MKVIKTLVLGALALVALLVFTVVGLQAWYRLTPVALSVEANALIERAAQLPTTTENGYRLNGINAPRDQDAVVYGRCMADTYSSFRAAEEKQPPPPINNPDGKAAWDAYWKARGDRQEQRMLDCRKTGEPLKLPKALTDAKINLATTRADLAQIASIAVDSLLLSRAEAVWAGEARRVGASFDAPLPPFLPLVSIERSRIAKAAAAWDAGDRAAATRQWANTIQNWVKSADDTLIDAVLSVNVLTQTLIVMQQSVAQEPTLDEATAEGILKAIAHIDAMPQALADSMVAEWQSTSSAVDVMKQPAASLSLIESSWVGRWVDRASQQTLDTNDTLNRIARGNVWSQRAIVDVARGAAVPDVPAEWAALGCDSLGAYSYACLPFMRNPVGRVTSAIAMPFYVDYGVRVADLMTLANAARLTIHARRQGLSGVALAKWVADAPPQMRDVRSKQPFRYDVNERKLNVVLQTKSTVLGDKGPYSLPL
jgi:hypothetical protein